MRRALKRLSITLVVLLAAIQMYRPERSNPPTDPEMRIEAAHPMTPGLSGVWNRACRDCHSNDTVWPWYSNVAPVSWFVTGHVDHARRHMNVSEWGKYDKGEASSRLKKMCEFSRERTMPLSSYRLIHRNARLSDDDIDEICSWAAATRQALKATLTQGAR